MDLVYWRNLNVIDCDSCQLMVFNDTISCSWKFQTLFCDNIIENIEKKWYIKCKVFSDII